VPVFQVMDNEINTEVCCARPVILCILYYSDVNLRSVGYKTEVYCHIKALWLMHNDGSPILLFPFRS
jgi:hypothetical protein